MDETMNVTNTLGTKTREINAFELMTILTGKIMNRLFCDEVNNNNPATYQEFTTYEKLERIDDIILAALQTYKPTGQKKVNYPNLTVWLFL